MIETTTVPGGITIHCGDALAALRGMEVESVQCCVTSPPYWGLRSYLAEGQDGKALELGAEPRPDCLGWATGAACETCYVCRMVAVFREVRRVLRRDGVLWLNLGDSYTAGGCCGDSEIMRAHSQTSAARGLGRKNAPLGMKPKNLCMIPARVALALQADGWYLRSDVIWNKPNPMPESVTDRPTSAHEHIFLLSKSEKYFYDAAAVAEQSVRPGDVQTFGGAKARNGEILEGDPRYRNGSEQWGRTVECGATRNCRNVWTLSTTPYPGSHFATFPPELPRRCIMAGSRPGDTVLDPFAGSGTSGMVARELGRRAVLCELNPDYVRLMEKRLNAEQNCMEWAAA